MKTLKNVFLLVWLLFFIASCDMNDELLERDLTNQITGTYKGAVTSSMSQEEAPATVDVTSIDDYTIGVRCYNVDMDTTIVLELYPDGNMMRVCFSEDDFRNEYGHGISTDHHMMGNNGDWTSWQQHMSSEHDQNDEHYGYFDMNTHEFDYIFKMKGSDGMYEKRFVGTKQ